MVLSQFIFMFMFMFILIFIFIFMFILRFNHCHRYRTNLLRAVPPALSGPSVPLHPHLDSVNEGHHDVH